MWRSSFVVVVAAVAVVASVTASASRGPTLRITSLAPVSVVGTGFAVRERVSVRLTVAGRRAATRRTIADGRGAFRVRFVRVFAASVCRGSIVVSASGAKGHQATARRRCRPPDPQAP
jgi:hypothetical protein